MWVTRPLQDYIDRKTYNPGGIVSDKSLVFPKYQKPDYGVDNKLKNPVLADCSVFP